MSPFVLDVHLVYEGLRKRLISSSNHYDASANWNTSGFEGATVRSAHYALQTKHNAKYRAGIYPFVRFSLEVKKQGLSVLSHPQVIQRFSSAGGNCLRE